MNPAVKDLRWLAVIPSAIVIYFVANWFVLYTWQQNGESSILGIIPLFYVVEVGRALIAPYAAVRAGAYVAGTGKVAAAAIVAALFVAFATLVSFGLVVASRAELDTAMPIWFTWLLVPIMLVSAGGGVYQEYEEYVTEIRSKDRAQIANELRPYYKTDTAAAIGEDVEEDNYSERV